MPRSITRAVVRGSEWRAAAGPLLFALATTLAGCDAGPAPAAGPGTLRVDIAGLPAGGQASVRVSGPGVSSTLASSGTVTVQGGATYTVAAARVVVADQEFAGRPDSLSVRAVAGEETGVAVPYALATGRMTVTIGGVGAANVTVSGGTLGSRTIAATTTLGRLLPAVYGITAAPVVSTDSVLYVPVLAQQNVTVLPIETPTPASVSYRIGSGSARLALSGVPVGTSPRLSLLGPDGQTRTIGDGQTLRLLPLGRYVATAPTDTTIAGDLYVASPASLTFDVAAQSTPTAIAAAYALASGRVLLAASGLPIGAPVTAALLGPDGVTRTLSSLAEARGIPAGTHTLVGAPVTIAGDRYAPSVSRLTLGIPASLTPVTVPIGYTLTTGHLALAVSGLPAGAPALVTVTDAGGGSRVVTGSTTLVGLAPGVYSVVASPITVGSVTYGPTPAQQVVSVAAGTTPTLAIAYAP